MSFKFNFNLGSEVRDGGGGNNEGSSNVTPLMCNEVGQREFEEVVDVLDLQIARFGKYVKRCDIGELGLEYLEGDDEDGVEVFDVEPGIYEGGSKVWECTFDLLDYLVTVDMSREDKILDVGCGAGLLGIYSLMRGVQSVHFQDYNADVLRCITAPNLALNLLSPTSHTRYFAGDWDKVAAHFNTTRPATYTLILSSETIYNPSCYGKLLALFDAALTKEKRGQVLVACKSHYFGVGGGSQHFIDYLERNINNHLFKGRVVKELGRDTGLRRDILMLTRIVEG